MECLQRAGEVLYLPAHWRHATINTIDTVGVAINHYGGESVQAVDVKDSADCPGPPELLSALSGFHS